VKFHSSPYPLEKCQVSDTGLDLFGLEQRSNGASRVLNYGHRSVIAHLPGRTDHFAAERDASLQAGLKIGNGDVYKPLCRQVGVIPTRMANARHRSPVCGASMQ